MGNGPHHQVTTFANTNQQCILRLQVSRRIAISPGSPNQEFSPYDCKSGQFPLS